MNILIKNINPLTKNLKIYPAYKFSLFIPRKKLHFINHPEHGQVYPIAVIDTTSFYRIKPLVATGILTFLNSLSIYSIYSYQTITLFNYQLSYLSDRMFLTLRVLANLYMLFKFSDYTTISRRFVTNMYLLRNGRQILIELLNGEKKVMNIKDIFDGKYDDYEKIEFGYGANNYFVLMGRKKVFDLHTLSGILDNEIIDTNSVAYNYDIFKKHTWDYEELIEIKRNKREVKRFIWPTIKNLLRLDAISKYNKNKIPTDRKKINFKIFSFNK